MAWTCLLFPMHEEGTRASSSLFALLRPERLSISILMHTKVGLLCWETIWKVSLFQDHQLFTLSNRPFKKMSTTEKSQWERRKTSDICTSPGETTARSRVLWHLMTFLPTIHDGMHKVTHQKKIWALPGLRKWLRWKSSWYANMKTWIDIPSTLV